jgi:hypothetical protein
MQIDQAIIVEVESESSTYAQAAQQIRNWNIATDVDFAQASETVKLAKANFRRLDDKRKELTQPLLRVKNGIDKLFRPALDALEDIERTLKKGLADYTLGQQRLAASVMAESAALASQGVVPTAIVPEVPSAQGVSVKAVWDPIVTDPDAVPRELCSPDLDKIRARGWYADTVHNPPQEIPGVRWELRGQVTVRK